MLSLQESELMLAIAQAGLKRSAWPQALRLLALQIQADATLLFLPEGGWDQTGTMTQQLPQMLAGLRQGRVYTAEELADRAMSGLAGIADLRAIGMAGSAWLMATRRRGSFRAVDSTVLSAFAPHFAQALAAGDAFNQVRARLKQSEFAARRLGVGLVQCDALGRVVSLDETAHDLLARAGVTLAKVTLGVVEVAPGLELAVRQNADGGFAAVLRATDIPLPAAPLIAQALGISLAEARLARALGMGDSLSEAAGRLGLTVETARAYSRQIFAKTGLRGQPDLMRKLWSGAIPLG